MAVDKNQGNQTKQVKRFQNLTTNYQKIIGKMSVSDRLSMIRSTEGQSLLSSLTPYQLAEMFPDYYKRQYPDVGVILKSISGPSFKPLSRDQADVQMGRNEAFVRSKQRTAQPEMNPSWVRKLEEQTGQKISDPGAKAQLSDAKKELLKEMEKSGGIKADDPRIKFLTDLSDDDLKKAGISKQTDDQGNIVFRRNQISDEEAKARVESIDPKIEAIRKTILGKESSGNYGITSFAEGKGSTASGGYQFADKTWQEQARKAGYDPSLYPRAKAAPPDVQDAVARSYIKDILRRNNGDISAVPREWYAGPKGYLTENELRVNRGLTLEQYTSDWMKKFQNNAKNAGVSDSQIATSLEDAKKQIRAEQESVLAGKEIPELPQGFNAGVTSFYNKLTDRQKLDFHKMLTAAGGGSSAEQTQVAVNKVNELYSQDPRSLQQGIFSGNGKLLFSDQSVAERSAQLNPYMQNSLNKFQEFAPPGTTITSTYRSPEHEIERRKPNGPGAHTRGSAVDLRTEGKSREELMQTVQALKRAGFTKILLEGDHIHAEVNPGQSFHISNLGRGNPNIDLRSATDAATAVAFNEELPGQQLDREKPKPAAIAKTEPTATPVRGAEVTTTQEQPQARQTSQQQSNIQQEPNKPEQIASYTPAEQLLVNRVNVNADGGKENINTDEIKAMPIKSLKGDNSVVVDKSNNPLFTMNTKEEQAVYNPKTRQVDIQPVTKTNPDMLGEKEAPQINQQDNLPSNVNQPQIVPVPVADSNPTHKSTDISVGITDELFKDPSFKRAIAKTRFVDTGDASLGGHFGMANADLG